MPDPSVIGEPTVSLKQQIENAIKEAMKARDKVRLETVRSIKKLLIEREVEARAKGQTELTEAEELGILTQLAKQRRESIAQYQQAGRPELAEQEAQELAVIEEYLPKQLSEVEIGTILDEIITQTGASSPKDLGKVMGVASKQLKGQADGKVIQAIAKAKLEGA